MRPHLSLCSQRVRASSTIVAAMLSVAGTRWKHKSGVIFASIGEICGLKGHGVDIRFVLGIDLGGTSQEVLQELLRWNIDARVVKHRRPGHTFHPKLYLFEWEEQGTIIIGSNNITEGGFFGNYEGAACVTYTLPGEIGSLCQCLQRIEAFSRTRWPCVVSADRTTA